MNAKIGELTKLGDSIANADSLMAAQLAASLLLQHAMRLLMENEAFREVLNIKQEVEKCS